MTSRSLLALVPASLFLGVACSSNIVSVNGGSTAGSSTSGGGATPVTTSSAGGATGAGGAGGGNPCSTDFAGAPILLVPARAGNLDLAGPSGTGLTIPEAEKIDCACVSMGTGGGSGAGTGGSGQTGYCTFGGSGALGAMFSTSNEVISALNVWPGYLGTLSFKSRDGTHSYAFSVSGKQVQKDGAPFTLDWNLAGFNQNPQFDQEVDELYDALIATFAPGFLPSQTCQQQNTCVVGSFGDAAYMEFPELGLTAWIASLSAGQPECSTWNRLDTHEPRGAPVPAPTGWMSSVRNRGLPPSATHSKTSKIPLFFKA